MISNLRFTIFFSKRW